MSDLLLSESDDRRIAVLTKPEQCKILEKNAIALGRHDLARAARKRAVQLKAESYGAPSDVERECIEAIYAYEDALSAIAGRRQPASRTWPMIERYGIRGAVERVVKRKADATGYTVLVKMGLEEHAFEAVILRHPKSFSPEAIAQSEIRLTERKGLSSST